MQAWENGDTAVTGIDCLVQLFAEWKSTAAQQLAAQRMTQKHALEFIKRGASERH